MISLNCKFKMAGECLHSISSLVQPWNGSDIILVVQDLELHSHKAILSLQSPVFKAMFNGQFREATAERVTLEGKTHKWMLQFLRLLYPANMIKDAKVIITDENVFEILKLADEYQASNVVGQCLAEVNLTNKNVLQLLPYAIRHDQSALPKLYTIIGSGVSVDKLGKLLPELVDKKVAGKAMIVKGRYLEKVLVNCCRIIVGMLRFVLKQTSVFSLQCGHTVVFTGYNDVVKCKECVSVFRTMLIDKALNQLFVHINDVEARQSHVKCLGNSIMQVLNLRADTTSENGS